MAAVESGQEPVNAPQVENQVAAPVEAQPVVDQHGGPSDWDAPVDSQNVVQNSAMATGRMKGTCKWFNNPRGYGFIEGEDGVDYFVHQTSIKATGYKSLKEGESLEFELLREGDGKVKAIKVTGPGGVEVIGTGHPGNRDSYGRGGGGGGGGYSGGGARTNVCFAWQKGMCERGENCRFAHREDDGGYGDGGGFGGGGGGGGNFSSGGGFGGGGGRKRGVCFAWQRGECFRGDACKFSHEDDGGGGGLQGGRGRGGGFGEKRGVCYAWQRGECWRGETCRFEHQETE